MVAYKRDKNLKDILVHKKLGASYLSSYKGNDRGKIVGRGASFVSGHIRTGR